MFRAKLLSLLYKRIRKSMRGKPFAKGKEKTGGRAKGVVNSKTMILDTFCKDIIESGIERFNLAMNELSEKNPTKFVDAYMTLLEFVQPKLSRQDSNITQTGELTVKFIEEKTYEEKNTSSSAPE